jgi:ribonuclease Z
VSDKFHIDCFSKGLYSSWFWHRPSRTLFDCGEGIGTYAGNFIFGIERICISHSHGDHIAGLPLLIGLRNSARGDKQKPLDIYYPIDDPAIGDYKNFIKARFSGWLTFNVNWHPIGVGAKIALDSNHWIESFPLRHTKRSLTLGYKIVEARTRLKAEFRDKDIPSILRSGVDKNALNEAYNANILAYCLDACDLNKADIANADVAIMDCSFLNPKDRDEPTHFTLTEALNYASEAGVKHMVAAHISSRYSRKDIDAAFKRENLDKVTVIYPNEVHEI